MKLKLTRCGSVSQATLLRFHHLSLTSAQPMGRAHQADKPRAEQIRRWQGHGVNRVVSIVQNP